MRTFGERSKGNLKGVHPLLVQIATKALQDGAQDFTVICGPRSKADQEKAFDSGNTKVHYPNSAHNATHPKTGEPRSCAIDVIPYPFTNWEDPKMLTGWKSIADAMMAAAAALGVKIRWGGDFNRDGNKTTSDAWDKPHFELHPWRDLAKA